jgi:hypothetical protein
VGPGSVLRRPIPLTIALVVTLVVAACGTATGSGSPAAPTPTPQESTASPSPSVGPPSPRSTPSASAHHSAAPASPSASAPTPTATSAHVPDQGASVCFGSLDTRDFFDAIAEAVTWPVYCAVLPSDWAVDAGPGKNTYALANGGRMVIGYHNGSGAHLQLREGHWCTDSPTACAPMAADLGPIAVGDLHGELVDLGGSDGFAVYVSPGQAPSWTITGTGLDEATFRSLVGSLALVGD